MITTGATIVSRDEFALVEREAPGILQVYYSLLPDGNIIWSNDINDILDDPNVSRDIDDRSIYQYLSFRNTIAPGTAYSHISSLLPGEMTAFDKEPVDIISSLKRSVSDIISGAQRPACFLSGGLDSSIVTALAAIYSPGITAFTLQMEDAGGVFHDKRSEVEAAKLIAGRYDIRHEIITMTADDLISDLDDMLHAIGEPFSGTLSTWVLSKAAADDADVILTGDGADELFAGYEPYKLAYSEDIYTVIGKTILMDDEAKEMFLGGRLKSFAKERATEALIRERVSNLKADDPLNRLLEFDASILLPDHVLKYASAFSRAFGLTAKSPFLDASLMAYVRSLPGEMKLVGTVTKSLLRKAAAGIVPDEIINRKKEGFVMPIEDWLATEKSLKEFVTDTLSPSQMLRYDYLDPVAVQMLLKTYYDDPLKKPALARIIWNFTCLYRWLSIKHLQKSSESVK